MRARGTSPIRSNESEDVDPTSRTNPLPVFKNSVFSLPLKYCIHGYCEDAQEDCCNEECDKGKQVMYSSRGLENECSGSKLHAPAKVFQSFVPPKYCGKFLGSHSISREKEVQTGKTRNRPIEEALSL
ncbi:hypothetical protein T459_10350 [Capsicum annuum]|uniref:Uncharacterized protein n=1 Tax=Capsicum annuum TaxID=4072 RepID=A0A2G3A1Z1_CAPAN|nr:hypothetical protein T459_10350 [Capsicum annuum]